VSNPYATVKQAYTEASVLTASREQLVVMLYDGALRFLRQSAESMRAGNRELARTRMRSAEAIIDELNWTLDMSYGDIPRDLRRIYLFSKRQLVRANLEQQPAMIEGVARLLAELRDAWATIAQRAEQLAS
jgi:flagellar secretion chaperone FliS